MVGEGVGTPQPVITSRSQSLLHICSAKFNDLKTEHYLYLFSTLIDYHPDFHAISHTCATTGKVVNMRVSIPNIPLFTDQSENDEYQCGKKFGNDLRLNINSS